MQWYPTPEAEAEALRRAAARARCNVRQLSIQQTSAGPRAVGHVDCPDGWAAARMLLALGVEDSQTPGARDLALKLRQNAGDDLGYARAVHDYVKQNVAFVREAGEVFQGGSYTLSMGAGDCDDHARVVYALGRAGGIPATMAFLHHGDDAPPSRSGPTHALAQLCPHGRCSYAETTVDARYGEHPIAAAERLGLVSARADLAREVRTMTEKSLPPPPPRYVEVNPPGRVAVDAQALGRLGYLHREIGDAADEEFRRAVLAFQRAAGIVADGLIGPQTRAAIAAALPPDEFGMGYAGTIGDATSAAAAVVHTRDLSPSFFRKVVEMTERFNAKGANLKPEQLLAVWNAESGIRANAKNPAADYYGLNQIRGDYLAHYGWPGTRDEYRTASAEDQLPIVERFYNSVAANKWHRLTSAGALYLLNFLPAYIDHADEDGYQLPQQFYADNKSLDVDGDGKISVGDLTRAVARRQQQEGQRWIEARRRLYSEGGAPPPSTPWTAPKVAGVALFVAGSAVAAWQVASALRGG